MTMDEIRIRLGLKDDATFAAEVEQRYLTKIREMNAGTAFQTKEMIIHEIAESRQSGKTTKILMSVIFNILNGWTSVVFVQSFGLQKVTYARLAAMLRFFPEIQLDICQGYDIVIRTINGPKLAARIAMTSMDLICARFDETFCDDCKAPND